MTNAERTSPANAPIGRWLNFTVDADDRGPIYHLGFGEQHIGNPMIRALHGGAIAAFLEVAAQSRLAAELEEAVRLKTVTISVDYLASSRPEDMTARVEINRIGRRVAFLHATGWQGDETRPVAIARICLRIGAAK